MYTSKSSRQLLKKGKHNNRFWPNSLIQRKKGGEGNRFCRQRASVESLVWRSVCCGLQCSSLCFPRRWCWLLCISLKFRWRTYCWWWRLFHSYRLESDQKAVRQVICQTLTAWSRQNKTVSKGSEQKKEWILVSQYTIPFVNYNSHFLNLNFYFHFLFAIKWHVGRAIVELFVRVIIPTELSELFRVKIPIISLWQLCM